MNTILVIARLTYREAIRRKIVLAALLLGLAFLLIYGLGFYFIQNEFANEPTESFRQSSTIIRTQAVNFLLLAGMYVVNFLTIAIAALISADSLAGEIQSGTIQSVVTKPVRRSQVVLGKWLGHAFLIFLYLLLMAGGVAVIVRLIAGFAAPNIPAGIALIYFNAVLVMTLTLVFSSMFSTLATGGAVFGAYGLAFIGGWVERIGTMLNNQTAMDLGIVSSLLLPSEALWNKASYVMTSPLINLTGMSPFTGASQPSTLMLVYAAIYLLVTLAIAIRQFKNRDL
jgi:ABC-type transport system involved in multi-copper enzyme maturation permease subunit